MAAPLSPAQRDRTLLVIEGLCAGHNRLDQPVVVGGLLVTPVDLLIEVAASGSVFKFPAMLVETMSKAMGQVINARTYAEACRAMLLHWPRVQIVREEQEALDKMNREQMKAEADAHLVKEKAARAEAERLAEKQRRADEKAALAARKAETPKPEKTGWAALYQVGKRRPPRAEAA